jgi:hypothetical protein
LLHITAIHRLLGTKITICGILAAQASQL